MKRSVRQLIQDWQPIFGNQETPPFTQMHYAAQNYDNTSFDEPTTQVFMPEKAPSGRGLHHSAEDRDSSHFMGQYLHRISPHLANIYRGGAANEHLSRFENRTDVEYSSKLRNKPIYLGRTNSGFGRAMESFIR